MSGDIEWKYKPEENNMLDNMLANIGEYIGGRMIRFVCEFAEPPSAEDAALMCAGKNEIDRLRAENAKLKDDVIGSANAIRMLTAENARQRAWIDGVMAQERHSLAAVPYAYAPCFAHPENAPTMKTVELITRPAPFEDK